MSFSQCIYSVFALGATGVACCGKALKPTHAVRTPDSGAPGTHKPPKYLQLIGPEAAPPITIS